MDPDPHHFGNLDPHPHQIKIRIRIRIKIYKLDPEPDPDPHQFADVKPKCMEYEPILALFQWFEPFFEARIWIWISIWVKSLITSQQIKNQNRHQGDNLNPDLHPDPHQSDADPQHRVKVLSSTTRSNFDHCHVLP